MIKSIQNSIGDFLFAKKDKWLQQGPENLNTYFSSLKDAPEGVDKDDKRAQKHLFLAEKHSMLSTLFENTYGEWSSTDIHTFTPQSVENQKHLVIFWGGGTSVEGMLSEIHGLASKTNLTIHTFNYPSVNDSEGKIYTHSDLVQCSKAVLDTLNIPMDKTIFYGDCYGAAVAESTYQDLAKKGNKPAGRILSNSFTNFSSVAHNIIFTNLRMMLFSDPTTYKSFFATALLYTLLSPIMVFAHLFICTLPFIGWGISPLKTATQQSTDLWVTNRANDTVISSATVNRKFAQSDDWRSQNSLLSVTASKERSARFGNQPHFADLADVMTNEEDVSMYNLIERFANECIC